MSSVRVRFAPSPTGFFHIGSARTALFNWLYAKKMKGTFILRIEDTDAERNTPEALRSLLTDLKWLGLEWDEGPEIGGAFGPYFQSQRGSVYSEYLELLKKTGRVYEKEGAIWLRVSGQAQVIDDVIRGRVERLEEKDFVIVRSNGTPVFHFVNVVDDIAMKVTHVIRGEDHLSNTSKHVELYKAFDSPIPVFAHIPLILKTEGSGKMSKRDQGALIEGYKQRFFLPQALINYLALLGWSPKNDQEFLSVNEIIQAFDLKGINKNNARFDEKKLSHINAEHLRALSQETFVEQGIQVLKAVGKEVYLKDKAYLEKILLIVQEKLRSLEELPNFIDYFFHDNFSYEEEALKKVVSKSPVDRLKEAQAVFETSRDFTSESLELLVKSLSVEKNVPTGNYIHALRLAISGKSVGPSLYAMLNVLGKARVQQRIERFLRFLQQPRY